MSNIPRLPLAKYNELAGSEWPSFPDYLKGKIPTKLKQEIRGYEEQEYINDRNAFIAVAKDYNKRERSFNSLFAYRYFFFTILPAAIGTGLYFYLGGTLLKFFIIFLCLRFVSIMHTQVLHRWLSHNMFEPKKWARPILLWFLVAGVHYWKTAGWVTAHRAHHKEQDSELDPYPPTWGLLELCFLWNRYYRHAPFPRHVIKPDVLFVFRNILWLWLINAAIIAYIDIDIFLLGWLFIRFYAPIEDGASNFLLHDGFKTKVPVNYPVYGYFVSLFVGIESVHIVHSEKPWIFNQAKHVPGAIDLGYWLLKPFAATERE